MNHRIALSLIVLLAPLAGLHAAEPPAEKRIVFLGDSITQAGRYIEIVEAALIAQYPESNRMFIPLGLASETVSGLSEPGHAGGKFPRPDLHERLERVLDRAKPDLVIACYGMNDGIYHPLDNERTKAFQAGMTKLHDKVTAAGARIIHITPPVFDPLPIKSRVLPAGLDKYEKPFEGYNAVLDAYAQWLLDMRADKKWEVLDLHGPMNKALADKRKTDPQFTFAKDGVHPSPEGQLLIARILLDAWGLNVKPDGTPDHPNGAAILEKVQKKHRILRLAWLSHVGHKRPGVAAGLPIDEAEKQAAVLDAEAHRLATKSGAEPKQKPVKVFILAGQSNMEGHGFVTAEAKRNEGKGSLEYLAKSPATRERFKHLLGKDGKWAVRDDVWIHYLDRKGPLTVGFGANSDRIGPEMGFGKVVGAAYDEPVLLIKLAWGGKSLAKDFRPPSSGGEVGPYYTEIIKRSKDVLENLKSYFLAFDGRGYEIAGFGWHQGWNDRVNQAFNDEYEKNLANFIRDIRKDLGVKNLPFVVAETGMSGPDEKHPRALSLMKAQAAVGEYKEFQGNVAFVPTKMFWRDKEVSPSGQAYHWNTNAETYYLIGEAMGEAMKKLVGPGR